MRELAAPGARSVNCGIMTDDQVKAAVALFLKTVSFNAQRELEKSVRKALASGRLQGGEVVTAGVTLSSKELDIDVTIFSKIEL
jgi:hypothetical protein